MNGVLASSAWQHTASEVLVLDGEHVMRDKVLQQLFLVLFTVDEEKEEVDTLCQGDLIHRRETSKGEYIPDLLMLAYCFCLLSLRFGCVVIEELVVACFRQ